MSSINLESSSVQSYLNSLQAVISRMAANSAASKTWCITLISAVIVFATGNNRDPQSIWVSAIPLTLFFALDSYYLGLERRFRAIYNEFVRKLHAGTAKAEEVFIISLSGGMTTTLFTTVKASLSISVWPFYGLTLIMLAIIRTWVF